MDECGRLFPARPIFQNEEFFVKRDQTTEDAAMSNECPEGSVSHFITAGYNVDEIARQYGVPREVVENAIAEAANAMPYADREYGFYICIPAYLASITDAFANITDPSAFIQAAVLLLVLYDADGFVTRLDRLRDEIAKMPDALMGVDVIPVRAAYQGFYNAMVQIPGLMAQLDLQTQFMGSSVWGPSSTAYTTPNLMMVDQSRFLSDAFRQLEEMGVLSPGQYEWRDLDPFAQFHLLRQILPGLIERHFQEHGRDTDFCDLLRIASGLNVVVGYDYGEQCNPDTDWPDILPDIDLSNIGMPDIGLPDWLDFILDLAVETAVEAIVEAVLSGTGVGKVGQFIVWSILYSPEDAIIEMIPFDNIIRRIIKVIPGGERFSQEITAFLWHGFAGIAEQAWERIWKALPIAATIESFAKRGFGGFLEWSARRGVREGEEQLAVVQQYPETGCRDIGDLNGQSAFSTLRGFHLRAPE